MSSEGVPREDAFDDDNRFTAQHLARDMMCSVTGYHLRVPGDARMEAAVSP